MTHCCPTKTARCLISKLQFGFSNMQFCANINWGLDAFQVNNTVLCRMREAMEYEQNMTTRDRESEAKQRAYVEAEVNLAPADRRQNRDLRTIKPFCYLLNKMRSKR